MYIKVINLVLADAGVFCTIWEHLHQHQHFRTVEKKIKIFFELIALIRIIIW